MEGWTATERSVPVPVPVQSWREGAKNAINPLDDGRRCERGEAERAGALNGWTRLLLPNTQLTRERQTREHIVSECQAHKEHWNIIDEGAPDHQLGTKRPSLSRKARRSKSKRPKQTWPQSNAIKEQRRRWTLHHISKTTHSKHKQQKSPPRPIHNQAAHPRDHICKLSCK